MAGKSYTMQEMRDIVSYLVEHHAYGEIRARSMWMDFASCGRTKRTWQSLKETFLKRILPDIHNPYYKLTDNQIASFRSGFDVSKRNMNKLEFHEVSANNLNNSNTAGPSEAVLSTAITGENVESKLQGLHSTRSSTETVSLDATDKFAVAEEVIRALKAEEDVPASPSKSLKDMIVFTEPLTPMMAVVADWESDSNHSDTENNSPKQNGTEATVDCAATASTTASVTADTFLPNNQEADGLGQNGEMQSNKTTSQNTDDNVIATNGLKSALKSNNKSTEVSIEPPKKKVRLSDTLSQMYAIHESTNEPSDKGVKTRSKQQSKTVEQISTVTELLAILSDSVLPNNPEGIEAIKKFLQSKASQSGNNSEESSNLEVENTNKAVKNTTATKNTDASSTTDTAEKSDHSQDAPPKRTTRSTKKVGSAIASQNSVSENIDSSGKGETAKNKNKTKSVNHTVDNMNIANSKRVTRANKNTENTDSSGNLSLPEVQSHENTPSPVLGKGKRIISPKAGNINKMTPNKRAEVNSPKPTSDNESLQEETDKSTRECVILVDSSPENSQREDNSVTERHEPSSESIQEAEADKNNEQNTFEFQSTESEKEGEAEKSKEGQTPNIQSTESIRQAEAKLSNKDETPKIQPTESTKEVITSLNCATPSEQPNVLSIEDGVKQSKNLDYDQIKSTQSVKDPEQSKKNDKIHIASPNKITPVVVAETEVEIGLSEPSAPNSQTTENGAYETATDNTNSDIPLTNPCLQSVSLFEETENDKPVTEVTSVQQTSKAPEVDKSPNKIDQNPLEPKKNQELVEVAEHKGQNIENASKVTKGRSSSKEKQNQPSTSKANKEAVVLLPSHSSESDTTSTEPIQEMGEKSASRTAKALPRLFGFCDGNLRNKGRYYGKRSGKKCVSESSESESDVEMSMDDDFVPVPRSRNKPRYMRRPAEGRVRMLRDGSLVAVCGGRVYGLVAQRGRRVYNLKYSQRDEDKAQHSDEAVRVSSSSPAPSPQPEHLPTEPRSSGDSKNMEDRLPCEPVVAKVEPPKEPSSVTLTKNTITLTGDMERILSILPKLQQVMRGLEPVEAGGTTTPADDPAVTSTDKQAVTAADKPAVTLADKHDEKLNDDEIRERVNAREAEIFREIADREAASAIPTGSQEQAQPNQNLETRHSSKADTRVSLRRKRPPNKEFPPQNKEVPPPATRSEHRGSSESDREIIIQEGVKRRRGRPPKTALKEPRPLSPETMELKSDDSGTLYSLPLSPRKPGRSRANKVREEIPVNVSVESTQGYQDTDISFIEIRPKRRRKSYQIDYHKHKSASTARQRFRRSQDRPRCSLKPQISARRIDSSDDETVQRKETVSSIGIIERVQDSAESVRLTPIQESIGSADITFPGLDTSNTDLRVDLKMQVNSSTVSLPPSPEISIVENISVPSPCHALCNTEHQCTNDYSEEHVSTRRRKRVSIGPHDISLSCPLEQDVAVTSTKTYQISGEISNRSSVEEMEICVTNLDEDMEKTQANPTVTDSLLTKVDDVKINETSESMQNGLINLRINSQSIIDVEVPKQTLNVRQTSKGKNRCSTPNKKPKLRKSEPPMVSTVPEEEIHVESCSQIRRQSYPGSIDINRDVLVIPKTGVIPDIPKVVISRVEDAPTINKWKVRTPRIPKRKIIKVKIQKPKKANNELKKKKSSFDLPENVSKSFTTDEDLMRTKKEKKSKHRSSKSNKNIAVSASSSTELIHNHSDSCLAAAECAIDGSTSDSGVVLRHLTLTPSPDCFSSDAQDALATTESISDTSQVTAALGLSNLGALLTEESLPSPDNSWYLLSEDEEYVQQNAASEQMEEQMLRDKYGPHITSLYPRACVVPHLSTITEASSDTRGSATSRPLSPPEEFVSCSSNPACFN